MIFAELVQIGINNIIIAKTNGREMNIYEERLIDQFAKTSYANLRLQELVIQQELEEYEEAERLKNKDSRHDPKTAGNGDNPPGSKV